MLMLIKQVALIQINKMSDIFQDLSMYLFVQFKTFLSKVGQYSILSNFRDASTRTVRMTTVTIYIRESCILIQY